jgi:hypothetical protein
LREDRRRQATDFQNNEFGPKRRWQGGNNTEPKTVFSRLSARVPSTADDSGDEDDNAFKVKFLPPAAYPIHISLHRNSR